MKIYDGRYDKKVPTTNRTIAVVSSNRIVCDTFDTVTIRKNGREDWSLFYCESGCMYFDGEKMQSGKVWIYAPFVAQRYTVYSKDKTVYRYIHFTGSDVNTLLSSLKILPSVAISVKSSSIIDIFESVCNSLKDDSPLSHLTAEYQTLRLISKIAPNNPHSSEKYMLKRVMDTMEHSFAAEYDAKEYADMLNISVSRFNHLFKEHIGISPYSYYLKLRIDNACSLLEETKLKIKDIAEKCGYTEALYFTQAFKKQMGLTPSAYRKANKIAK